MAHNLLFAFTSSDDPPPSIEATEQTEGFAHAFKLAFDDPKQAYYAYDQFIEDGTIPAHGKGPWVVFKGRKQGVVISL